MDISLPHSITADYIKLKVAEYPISVRYRENLDVPAKLDFSATVPRVACGVALAQLQPIRAQVI